MPTQCGWPIVSLVTIDLDPTARAVAVAARTHPAWGDDEPAWIDAGGLLRRGGVWVALPDIDWHLAELFLANVDRLVRRDELEAAAWPGRAVPDTALNVRIKLLRKRFATVG